MKKYIGIDGGGTKTKLIIIDADGHVLYQTEAGPTSIDTVSEKVISLTFKQLFRGILFDDVAGIFAGVGGVANQKDKQFLKNLIIEAIGKSIQIPVGVDNDVVNALAGSLGHDQGIVLVAGTGSAVYGRHAGQIWRTGGISAKEGDPGSAYDLGFQALRHLGKVIDGRCPMTNFGQDLMATLKISTYEQLAEFFQASDRTKIARIAPVVTSHHEDPYAQGIMNQAINELVLMVSTVYHRLGFKQCELGLVGSLANANTPYKANLIKHLYENLPLIKIIAPPKFDPVYGSALLARNGEKS
jgi:N-acetylglucosamine kinase-like BadF-type ATPase